MSCNINELASVVKANCEISSALYFLTLIESKQYEHLETELIDLFVHEKELPPESFMEEVAKRNEEINAWAERKQGSYFKRSSQEFQHLKINELLVDPILSAELVRAEFWENNILYVGGIVGQHQTPIFLLAEIDKKYEDDGTLICFTGKEIARDLYHSFALDAARRPGLIYIRNTAIRYKMAKMLYNKAIYENSSAAQQAFYLVEGDESIDKLVHSQAQSVLHHELGHDVVDKTGIFPRSLLSMVQATCNGQEQRLFFQAINEVLADTVKVDGKIGSLVYIIKHQDELALALFMLDHTTPKTMDQLGRAKVVLFYGGIKEMYADFLQDKDWERVDSYRHLAFESALRIKNNIF